MINKSISQCASPYRKIILFINVIVFCFGAGYSAEVTVGDVQSVAGVHARLGYTLKLNAGLVSAPDYSVKEIATLNNKDTGELLSYVVILEPKGFIAVSKDDNIKPVIAYSFNSNFSFDENEENILLHMLRMDMGMRIEAIPLTSDKIKKENKQLWDNYLSNPDYIYELEAEDQWPADDDTGWLDTTWDQSAPYNNLCPQETAGGGRTIVGCVATAMAQVVNFNRYPFKISFDDSDSYTSVRVGATTIEIDGDSSTHDFPSFDELNSKLSGIKYSEQHEGYAPALSFACGIIVKMAYGTAAKGGSAANFSAENFTEKLGYTDARKMWTASDPDYFYDVLEEDMKNRRPAMIAIYLTSALKYGHAIVVDGYRTDGDYHLNFGWGSGNPGGGNNPTLAWYSLPDGMPADYTVVYYGVLSITSPEANPYNPTGGDYSISYPNPFRVGEVGKVKIAMPADPEGYIDKVMIYTPAGQMVREIPGGESPVVIGAPGFLYVEWDGRNESGNLCVQGLYFYSMRTTEGKNFKGKITILR